MDRKELAMEELTGFLTNMTKGEMMFCGGIVGTVLCLLIVLIAMKVFEKSIKRTIEKIMKSL